MKSDLLCQYKLKIDFIKSSNQIVSRANPGNLEIIRGKDHKNLFLQSHWSFCYFTKSRVEEFFGKWPFLFLSSVVLCLLCTEEWAWICDPQPVWCWDWMCAPSCLSSFS